MNSVSFLQTKTSTEIPKSLLRTRNNRRDFKNLAKECTCSPIRDFPHLDFKSLFYSDVMGKHPRLRLQKGHRSPFRVSAIFKCKDMRPRGWGVWQIWFLYWVRSVQGDFRPSDWVLRDWSEAGLKSTQFHVLITECTGSGDSGALFSLGRCCQAM